MVVPALEVLEGEEGELIVTLKVVQVSFDTNILCLITCYLPDITDLPTEPPNQLVECLHKGECPEGKNCINYYCSIPPGNQSSV